MKDNYNRTIFSWSIYDFANQPFTTLILTFVYSTFFVDFIALSGESGAVMWGRAVTLSSLAVALISPIMGAIADHGGYRKKFLIFWTWICVIFSILLYFPIKGEVILALSFFCVANIGFEMGGVFLNAYLPEIAPKEKIGRISGYGWSFGYIGGLIALAVCFILFISPENPINPFNGQLLNLDTGEHIRIINVFIGIWFAVFSIPTFLFLKDKNKKSALTTRELINGAFKSLNKTFKEVKCYKETLKFLLARLVYNDALITIFAFGGIYAKQVFDFTFNEIFLFGIVLNVTAGLGALAMGFLDDILGGKKTIQISNVGFIVACTLAVIAPEFNNGRFIFWIAGSMIGVFSGPNQAASRSLMGRMTPKNKENEFYGFFAFSGKATAFVGPLLFSTIVSLTDSIRLGLAVVSVLFLIGIILLNNVNEKQGIEDANSIT